MRIWIQNAPIKVIDYASSAEIDRNNKEIEKETVKERKKGTRLTLQKSKSRKELFQKLIQFSYFYITVLLRCISPLKDAKIKNERKLPNHTTGES